jgi:sensor histidine kinase YesM
MQRIYDFLDKHILPWPVRYLSHRFVILLTISLLIPLVAYAANQTLVLLVNSYLNTMSVAVSSIVLLYATISEVHQKQIAELQEKRAQEDHTHVVEMHTLMQQSLIDQQKQIEDLKQMIAAQHGKDYTPQAAKTPQDLRTRQFALRET